MNETISQFMARYNKEYDFYLNLSIKVESQLRENLNESGIRSIVSSRAKKPKRLRDKITSRDEKKKYKSVEDIFLDIVDLAGVRVAIYFPGDMKAVDDLIRSSFDVIEEKNFPETRTKKKPNSYSKIFSGYAAKHYRVNLKGETRYSKNYTVEIQVASVLMHAWSEVEHDLVYKPLQGKLSNEELMILDEINGLVLAGNLALERLQQAGINRTQDANYEFKNHFDLASFFANRWDDLRVEGVNFSQIFKLLKYMEKTKRSDLINISDWVENNREIYNSKGISRFSIKNTSTAEFRKIIYAICALHPLQTAEIVEDFDSDIAGFLDISDYTRNALANSMLLSFFIDPELKLASELSSQFEGNLEKYDNNTSQSLSSSLKESNRKLISGQENLVELINSYIGSLNNLKENFTKSHYADCLRKNQEINKMIEVINYED